MDCLQGCLFRYHEERFPLVAFQTSSGAHSVVVLIGGLTDGLLPTPYAAALAESLQEDCWSLVMPILSSSYNGFGTTTLGADCEELDALISCLLEKRKARNVVLMGHSTGCQDSVYYMRDGKYTKHIRGIILQGPVSDREALFGLEEGTAAKAELAGRMCKEGKSEELMPRSAFDDIPITAHRYRSFTSREGEDDLFSSDLEDGELKARLGHIGASTAQALLLFSGADEYVPSSVQVPALSKRLVAAMGGSAKTSAVIIEGANHAAEGHVDEVVTEVAAFLSQLKLAPEEAEAGSRSSGNNNGV